MCQPLLDATQSLQYTDSAKRSCSTDYVMVPFVNKWTHSTTRWVQKVIFNKLGLIFSNMSTDVLEQLYRPFAYIISTDNLRLGLYDQKDYHQLIQLLLSIVWERTSSYKTGWCCRACPAIHWSKVGIVELLDMSQSSWQRLLHQIISWSSSVVIAKVTVHPNDVHAKRMASSVLLLVDTAMGNSARTSSLLINDVF